MKQVHRSAGVFGVQKLENYLIWYPVHLALVRWITVLLASIPGQFLERYHEMTLDVVVNKKG
jgi:hypothetical protein